MRNLKNKAIFHVIIVNCERLKNSTILSRHIQSTSTSDHFFRNFPKPTHCSLYRNRVNGSTLEFIIFHYPFKFYSKKCIKSKNDSTMQFYSDEMFSIGFSLRIYNNTPLAAASRLWFPRSPWLPAMVPLTVDGWCFVPSTRWLHPATVEI